jgi:hypothetical protein
MLYEDYGKDLDTKQRDAKLGVIQLIDSLFGHNP